MIDTPVEPLAQQPVAISEPAISVAGPITNSRDAAYARDGDGGNHPGRAATDDGREFTSVKILPVDVYGNSETTTTFDVANGIVQAVNNGANILNLSLGGTGDSQLLQNVVIQVLQQGIPNLRGCGQ